MYGHQVTNFERDRFATRIYKSSAVFAGSLAPGGFLVDTLPWLRHFPAWFPGAGWQSKAAEWAESDRVLYTEMLEAARVQHNYTSLTPLAHLVIGKFCELAVVHFSRPR